MSYNLLFDTQFTNTNNNWKYINCTYKEGFLISNNKVFGIEQEIVLPDITKLYFRCKYDVLDSDVYKAYIGIQNKSTLSINKKWTKKNKQQLISVVEDTKTEKIKVHVIFESNSENNVVKISEPLLYDLNRMHKSFWLRFILDVTLKYRYGYSYNNILTYSEIKPDIFNLEPAKVGSIISTNEEVRMKINAKLDKGKRYLIKLDFKPINTLGKIWFNYGVMKSIPLGDEQIYLSFKATDTDELFLNIKPDDILPYQLNLKHILLIETDKVGIDKEDIPYLPFI